MTFTLYQQDRLGSFLKALLYVPHYIHHSTTGMNSKSLWIHSSNLQGALIIQKNHSIPLPSGPLYHHHVFIEPYPVKERVILPSFLHSSLSPSPGSIPAIGGSMRRTTTTT